MKKQLVFKPRKGRDKIEIVDDIPRRWLEEEDSPLKNKEYYAELQQQEYGRLCTSYYNVSWSLLI